MPEVCVVYLSREHSGVPEVLLGRKKTGLGLGKIVAPGGKLEPGETPVDAAVREVEEEVGIVLASEQLALRGELTYPFPTRPEWTQRSWVFTARGSFGDPAPSAELDAAWLPLENLPLNEMWDDAQFWLPAALRGDFIKATFTFGADLSTVIDSNHPAFDRRRRGG